MLSRAYVALLSPTDGASPHVVSDLVARLVQRSHTVTICSVSLDPLNVKMVVDGTDLSLETSGGWYRVVNGNVAVCVQALRSLPVPTGFRSTDDGAHVAIEALLTTWTKTWPTPADRALSATADSVLEAWASRVAKKHLVVDGPRTDTLHYLSETAFCDAVELVLSAPAREA